MIERCIVFLSKTLYPLLRFALLNNCPANSQIEERSGSEIEYLTCDREVYCVLVQDTLSSAKYWFNPTNVPTWMKMVD